AASGVRLAAAMFPADRPTFPDKQGKNRENRAFSIPADRENTLEANGLSKNSLCAPCARNRSIAGKEFALIRERTSGGDAETGKGGPDGKRAIERRLKPR